MKRGGKFVLVSVLVTLVLLIILMGWFFIDFFSYGKEWADYDRLYYTGEGEAVVYLDGSQTAYKALYQEGQMYLSMETVRGALNSRFYVSDTGILLYTLPDETVEVSPGQFGWTVAGVTTGTDWPVCFVRDSELYVAVEYVALLTDMSYQVGTEPERLLISLDVSEETWTQVEKKTQVRYQAGRKSPILTEVGAGEEVCIIGTEGDWMKVRTKDGFIGYLPAKMLSDEAETRMVEKSYLPQDYTGARLEEPVCLAWHQVFVPEANDALTELLDATEGINVLSPTWFALSDEEGGFTSLADHAYVAAAHERGIQVWGLVNDFSGAVDKYALLSNTETRRKLIANLMATALEYDLDGINIDFEKIDSTAGQHFIQFIRELSVECRREGLVLSVDNYSPTGGWSWYYLREQGVVADYVIMMGYDEHWAGGTPGSTASLPFTEETLDLALAKVPAEKLIHGIPFYTRVWGEEAGVNVSSTAVSMVTAKNLLEEHDADIQWLDREGQYFGEYYSDGVMYRIWLEDIASLRLKLEVVSEAGVAGVACWKLGLENPDVWPVISEYLH